MITGLVGEAVSSVALKLLNSEPAPKRSSCPWVGENEMTQLCMRTGILSNVTLSETTVATRGRLAVDTHAGALGVPGVALRFVSLFTAVILGV
jgi:hypothetical protein